MNFDGRFLSSPTRNANTRSSIAPYSFSASMYSFGMSVSVSGPRPRMPSPTSVSSPVYATTAATLWFSAQISFGSKHTLSVPANPKTAPEPYPVAIIRPFDSSRSTHVSEAFGSKLLCVPQSQQSFVCTHVHYKQLIVRHFSTNTYHWSCVQNQVMRFAITAEVEFRRDL